MTMTSALSAPLSPSSGSTLTEGPIVLAAKPFDMTQEPLAVARWLAHREDRELHVISIVEDHDALAIASGAAPLPDRFYKEEQHAIANRLTTELAAHETDGVTCQVTVENGPGANAVVDLARQRNARLIVIGTGRHDALGRFIYGERAMQIVRAADRPVLVVPRGAARVPLHHAIVAVDFSRSSLRAACAIIPMLTSGAQLTLLHVRPASPKPSRIRAGFPGDAPCDDLFARFISLLPMAPGIDVTTRLLWGDPVDAIIEYGKAAGADLIACGRLQRHSLAERLFVGSVSAGLLRNASCAVLVAPELRDDALADSTAPLTGVSCWLEDGWSAQLEQFTARNSGRRIRFGVDVDAGHGGRCVVQDYLLRSLIFNQRARLALLLSDKATPTNRLALTFGSITDIALFSNIAGEDTRLVFGYDGGRGTLTLSPGELP